MRAQKLALMAGLTLGILCSEMAAQTKTACEATTTDNAEIVAAIRTMYAAATADDLDKFHSIATIDFYAFDNGKRFEGDTLMELIKKYRATGKTVAWTVVEPKVHASGDVAWVSYVNEGSITDTTGTTPIKWLESVGLVKEKGTWRIQFLNSARMEP